MALDLLMRRFRNVGHVDQKRLASQFYWLGHVARQEPGIVANVVSVSVFDHWLSEQESLELLSDVSVEEQSARNKAHASFCTLVAESTIVLSFVLRGRKANRIVFREFTSNTGLVTYFTPSLNGQSVQGRFWFVLPEWNCVYCEGYDDTNHFFYPREANPPPVASLVEKSGLFLLRQV